MSEFTQEEINAHRPKPFTVEIVTMNKAEVDQFRERISQLEAENEDYKMQLTIDRDKISQIEGEKAKLKGLVQELCGTLLMVRKEADKLESDKAELQRVVQKQKEVIENCDSIFSWITKYEDQIPDTGDGTPAWRIFDGIQSSIVDLNHLTPKNLSKFVTEEEYLRVKEVLNGRIADLSIDFMRLKSHAEALAETIKEFCLDYDNMDEYSQSLKAYRKDFPKEEK